MYARDRELTPLAFQVLGVETRTTPRRSIARRIARAAGWAFSILLGLVVLAFAFLHTPWGKEVVRSRVEAGLQNRVNGDVSLGSIDYTFAFGEVTLGDLTISDASGTPAIHLAKVRADVDRLSLAGDTPTLDELEVSGVDVAIVKNADGTSSLTGLLKRSRRKKPHVVVRHLKVGDVDVSIRKPDGTIIAVSDAAISGALDIDAGKRDYTAELSKVIAAVSIAKPDGTEIAIPSIVTALSLTANAIAGDVTATIAPMATTAEIDSPRRGRQSVAVNFGGLTLDLTNREFSATINELGLGALTIGSVQLSGGVDDGELRGDQRVDIVGVRIDSDELEGLVGRRVLGSDVSLATRIAGTPEAMIVSGGVDTAGGRIDISGTIDASELAFPRYDLAFVSSKLCTAEIVGGTGRDEPLPALESDLRIDISGEGIIGSEDAVAELHLTSGDTSIVTREKNIAIDRVDLSARIEGQTITVDQLDVEALGVDVTVKGERYPTREVAADVEITADVHRVVRELAAIGIEVPAELPLPKRLEITAEAHGNLDTLVDVDITSPRIALAGGAVSVAGKATLDRRDSGRLQLHSADITAFLCGLDLQSLARAAGGATAAEGSIGGDVTVHRRGKANTVDYDVTVALAKPAVAVHAWGDLDERGAIATVRTTRSVDGAELASAYIDLPLLRRAGKRTVAPDGEFRVDVDVHRRTLGEIAALVPERVAAKLRSRARSGAIEAHIALSGTPRRPVGSIDVDAIADLARLPGKAAQLYATADVASTGHGVQVVVDGSAKVAGVAHPLALVDGVVQLGSPFDGVALDSGAALDAATVALSLDVPERDVASLAALWPQLARIPGKLDARVRATGALASPEIDAVAAWTGYETAAGGAGRARFTLNGTPKKLAATIALGNHDDVTITADIARGAARTEITAAARAHRADIARLVPAYVADTKLAAVNAHLGRLDWNMDATIALAGGKLDRVDTRGALDITGASVAVPNSSRRYRDIAVRVEAGEDEIRIARLSARETDIEKENRKLDISGAVAFAAMKPASIELDITTDDWLVFGGEMGEADAPRATVDADIGVVVDLSSDIPAIEATVRKLDLSRPERFDRGHGVEMASVSGDIMFLGDPGVVEGKLAAPGHRSKTAHKAPRKHRPADIRVLIPRPIRIEKSPMDLTASGELAVAIRNDGVTTNGKLDVHGGTLFLFGQEHELAEGGTITFDRDHPHGEMALVFKRELPAATLRQLSKASGGRVATVSFSGSPSRRVVKLGGASNIGLFETLATHNGGRGMFHTEADMPASSSVQAPRGEQPLVLSFLAINLPHMLFLDRFNAWNDPYDTRDGYGRIEHFEGERYAGDNKSRVKVVSRPHKPGRSSAEVQYDRLFVNDENLAVGAGVRAGSRRGGGVGFFVEWSSDD